MPNTDFEIAPSASPSEPQAEPDETKHVPALDGIRGVAILLVLSTHLFKDAFSSHRVVNTAYRLFAVGWVGVDLFFVLSGFLITGILIKSRPRKNYFKNFYGRRTLRIFPLYYGVLIVCLAAGWLDREQVWLWTYLSNIRIGYLGHWETFSSSRHIVLEPFWSLAVEEHFYLVWPLLVFACPPRWLLRLAVGLAVLSVVCRSIFFEYTHNFVGAYVMTPFRIDGLLAGAACAFVAQSLTLRNQISRYLAPAFWSLLSIAVAIYLFTGWYTTSPLVATIGYAILAMLFSSLILLVTFGRLPLARRAFESGLLRFFGRYSYGIYAFHYSIFAATAIYLTPRLDPIFRFRVLSSTVANLFAISLAVAAALLSWHLYEKHFLRLKRYFH